MTKMIFDIIVKTGLGKKRGELEIMENNSKINGVLIMLGVTNKFSDGRMENGKITIGGIIKTFYGSTSFDFEGYLIGEQLTGIIKTTKGNYNLDGRLKFSSNT